VARQQSKDFYAAGFNALVKRWDKCVDVGGGYVEKFFSSFIYHLLYVLYPFLASSLTLPPIPEDRILRGFTAIYKKSVNLIYYIFIYCSMNNRK
jgi:hypothetical protein